MFLSVTVQQNGSAHLLSNDIIQEDKKVHRLITINTHALLNIFQVIRDTWLMQSILQPLPVKELRKPKLFHTLGFLSFVFLITQPSGVVPHQWGVEEKHCSILRDSWCWESELQKGQMLYPDFKDQSWLSALTKAGGKIQMRCEHPRSAPHKQGLCISYRSGHTGTVQVCVFREQPLTASWKKKGQKLWTDCSVVWEMGNT